MKALTLISVALILLNSCTSEPGEGNEQRLRTENFELRKENDSLKNILHKDNRSLKADTVQKLEAAKNTSSNYPTFPGKHALSLQWIGSDEPGSVTIVPANNGWYTITGSQIGKNSTNYLKINGRIKPITDRELEFDGEIETRVDHINNNEPCLKTGKKLFKATGTRKYWRLQDIANCKGEMVTDYVDIYF